MNNDPFPSSSAAHDGVNTASPDRDGASNDADEDSQQNGSAAAPSGSSESSDLERKRKTALSKKLQFMTHLMKSLDLVVFAEICTLYYMDISFFRLLLRIIPHFMFLTPKSEDFLLLLPAHRPHVFAIFIPNLICFLLHLFEPLHGGRASTQANRGYLHGGIIVDFVGQKAPTSRLSLLSIDILILAIQCLMLAVHADRERLRKIVMPARRLGLPGTTGGETTGTAAAGDTEEATRVTMQDHDAEERGVLRDGVDFAGGTDDIELQNLSNGSAHNDGEEREERIGLLDQSTVRQASMADMMDVLRSGNAILGDFYVVHAVRAAGNDYQTAAAYSLQTLGYTATMAARTAQIRARAAQAQAQQR